MVRPTADFSTMTRDERIAWYVAGGVSQSGAVYLVDHLDRILPDEVPPEALV